MSEESHHKESSKEEHSSPAEPISTTSRPSHWNPKTWSKKQRYIGIGVFLALVVLLVSIVVLGSSSSDQEKADTSAQQSTDESGINSVEELKEAITEIENIDLNDEKLDELKQYSE